MPAQDHPRHHASARMSNYPGTRGGDDAGALREMVTHLRRDVDRLDSELRNMTLALARSELSQEHGDRSVRQEVRVIEDAVDRLTSSIDEATNRWERRQTEFQTAVTAVDGRLTRIEKILEGDGPDPGLRAIAFSSAEFIKTFKAKAAGVAIGAGVASGASVVGIAEAFGLLGG